MINLLYFYWKEKNMLLYKEWHSHNIKSYCRNDFYETAIKS